MGALADRKFREWTEGLDTRQSMIAIFSRVRDIPYAPDTNRLLCSPKEIAEAMLQVGHGSCAPKHYLLAAMFRKLNLNVVYATFPFRWIDQVFGYPPALRVEAAELPVAYHLACRVQVGCRFALVDATWDAPLEKAGFPVNLHWDGIADTRCAVRLHGEPGRVVPKEPWGNACGTDPEQARVVPPGGEKDHWEAEDREQYYRTSTGTRTPSDLQRCARFYRDLNAWMETVRSPGH